jgi:hypothetical protein
MSETRYMPAKIATATDILLAVEASLPEDQVSVIYHVAGS